MSNTTILTYGCPECRGGQHPFEIVLNETFITNIICPYCRTKGSYQLRQWREDKHIDWTVRYTDGSARLYEIHDCVLCGGKFTTYKTQLKYGDIITRCRACEEKRPK